MSKKFIEDVRKIAKTDEILKRIPNFPLEKDKSSILAGRGEGFPAQNFDPCQFLYSAETSSYTFADLVDGIDGPRIQDGEFNSCAQVNTITGMRETGVSPTLKMILKPDGIFINSSSAYVYTSIDIISDPNLWDTTTKWYYPTYQEIISKIEDFYGCTAIASPTEVVLPTLDSLGNPVDDGWNFDITQTLYSVAYEYNTGGGGFIGGYIFRIAASTDLTINSHSAAGSALFIDFPGQTFQEGGSPPGFPYTEYVIDGVTNYEFLETMTTVADVEDPNIQNSFQLAVDVGGTNLWKPDPAESTAPLKYNNGVSTVVFEFEPPSYSRTGIVTPGKDGGFVLYELSGATPINNAYVYRRDRTLAAIVPVAQMQAYLA